jgi:hypothetical protein
VLLLLGISSLASLLAALVLGVRLLRLAARTHGVPELAMGTGFILGGFFGFLLILIGNPAAGSGLPQPLIELLFCVGMSLLSLGVCCTYVFVWQTFRRRSPIALVLTLGAIAIILGSLQPVWTSPVKDALIDPVHLLGDAVRLGGMLWGSVEALHYYAAMRRRLALGLANPVVTNRFLLWGIAMTAGVIVTLTSVFMTLSGMIGPDSWPYLIIGIFSFVSPAAQWLAFFPPRAYCEWVESRVAGVV